MKTVVYCEKELQNNRILIHKYDTKEELNNIERRSEYYYSRVGIVIILKDVSTDRIIDSTSLYEIRGLRLYLEYEGNVGELEELTGKPLSLLLEQIKTNGGESLLNLLDDIAVILDTTGLHDRVSV